MPQDELDTEKPVLRPLSRRAAEELLLLACLAPVAGSNLAIPFGDRLFATDSSSGKGGIAEASCGVEVSRALWLAADRKGSSVPLGSGLSEGLEDYDPLHEVLPSQPEREAVLKKVGEVDRPLGLKFDFIEICGGSGVVTKELIALGAVECAFASCAYRSPHHKEFGLIGVNVVLDGIARKCSRDHTHIPIQGKYTKPSAVYCPGLAVAFAELFYKHLLEYDMQMRSEDFDISGLESILANDVSVGLSWEQSASWSWKRSSHINVLEGKAALRLFEKVAYGGGDVRLPFLCDSHVARSAIAKGRSPSGALQCLLKKVCATCVGYGLYPAGVFSPTRYNPGDAPTRDLPMPVPSSNMICAGASPLQLRALAMMRGLRRWICGWIRLVLLLCPGVLDFLCDSSSSWRRHPSFVYRPGGRSVDFDSTLGYPGEGHPLLLVLCSLCAGLLDASLAAVSFPCFGLVPSFFIIISCSGFPGVIGAPKRWDGGDEERKQARAGITLHDGRRVTAGTSNVRKILLENFFDWLRETNVSPDLLVFASPPDLDRLNSKLVEYGRLLFDDGKPFYHYCETINALTVARPLIRRSLQRAWDLAFIWGSYEPAEHHVAMPFQILIALISAAWSWGWRREASIFALAWGALLRIGEVLDAFRKDLVLPSDVGFTIDYVLLKICEPKTRYRAARHQAGKLEQIDLIEVVRIGFEGLMPNDKLWNMSGSTLRARLTSLLKALALPHLTGHVPKVLTLASFRPGGATHLITVSESAELVRRRGRWASFKTMEMYLQEVAASTYLNDVSSIARENVLLALRNFPELMSQIRKFAACKIPETTWYFLLYPQGRMRQNG